MPARPLGNKEGSQTFPSPPSPFQSSPPQSSLHPQRNPSSFDAFSSIPDCRLDSSIIASFFRFSGVVPRVRHVRVSVEWTESVAQRHRCSRLYLLSWAKSEVMKPCSSPVYPLSPHGCSLNPSLPHVNRAIISPEPVCETSDDGGCKIFLHKKIIARAIKGTEKLRFDSTSFCHEMREHELD